LINEAYEAADLTNYNDGSVKTEESD